MFQTTDQFGQKSGDSQICQACLDGNVVDGVDAVSDMMIMKKIC